MWLNHKSKRTKQFRGRGESARMFKMCFPKKFQMYKVCLKSNGTVHAARITFITEKKALLSMMLQCLVVSKTKFHHSVTTTFFLHAFLQGNFFVIDNYNVSE